MAATLVWMTILPTGATAIRTTDKSQLLFGASLDLTNTLEEEYFRNHLNDKTGVSTT